MMTTLSIVALAALLIGGVARRPSRRSPRQQPQPQQEEFVPIDQLPPEEQNCRRRQWSWLRTAFIWVAFLVYVFSLVKRIRRVEIDLQRWSGSRADGLK